MSKTKKYIFVALLLLVSMTITISFSNLALAECTQSGLSVPTCTDINNEGNTSNLAENPIILWVNFFINLLAVTIIAGAAVMVALAGIQYIAARDNTQSVQAAKQKILNVVIGVFAFFFLFAFIQWLIPGGVFNNENKSSQIANQQTTDPNPSSLENTIPKPTTPQAVSSEFIIGKTKPTEDNTGQINSSKLKVHNGDLIITKAGTIIDGMDVKGFISIRAANVTIKNSVIRGRNSGYNNSSKGHLIDTSNSACVNAIIENNIIRPDYPRWWINGVHGGNFNASRNNISGTVDGFSITKGKTKITGNYLHDFYFSDQSQDQASSTPPKWTHNDGIQFRGGSGAGPHIVEGNNFYWYPGVGSYYNRNRALELGYSNGPAYYKNLRSEKTGRYNWGSGITISPDGGPVIGGKVSNNWFEGGQVGIQANYSYRDRSMNFGTISNNLFGGDQLEYKNSSYQIRYDKKIQIAGLLTNKWDYLSTVPVSKQGDNFYVGTNGGIRIN